MDAKKISAGDWVLCESMLTDRFYSLPAEVVKVAGQRVYIRRPQRNREGVIEDWSESFKSVKSVREVVMDEAHGMRMYEAECSAHEAYKLAAGDLYRAFIQSRDATLMNLRSE